MGAKNREILSNRLYILGYNQTSLADEIGVSRAAISAVFRGKRRPSVELSKKIADALEMDDREFRTLLLEAVS